MKDPLTVVRNGKPANIRDLWAPNPAFLIGGGPSIKDVDLNRLKERGIVSIAINQVAAAVPVKAWVFSDTQSKFHSSSYLDPAMMTFAPQPKLKRRFMLKTKDGFRHTTVPIKDTPNTWGFDRHTCFDPENFFNTTWAHWGPGKHQPEGVPKVGTLCTMLIGIRLLHYLGVRKIFLLGVDFRGRDGMCYGFPAQKKERNRRYKKETAMLELLLPVFKKYGVEIYNTNRDSHCRLFDWAPFDQAIDYCKGSIPPCPQDTVGWYSMKQTREEAKGKDNVAPIHYEEM